MADDSIAQLTYVILGLLFVLGPVIAGIVLLTKAGTRRRRAQLDYLAWLVHNGYQAPEHPGGMPLSMYPPQVTAAGGGLRVWGGILLGVGGLFFLLRIASLSPGM